MNTERKSKERKPELPDTCPVCDRVAAVFSNGHYVEISCCDSVEGTFHHLSCHGTSLRETVRRWNAMCRRAKP